MGNLERILDKLTDIATELEKDMDENGWTGRTVTLKFKLDTYQGMTSPSPVQTPALILFQFSLALNQWTTGFPRRKNFLRYVIHFFWVHFILNIVLDWQRTASPGNSAENQAHWFKGDQTERLACHSKLDEWDQTCKLI